MTLYSKLYIDYLLYNSCFCNVVWITITNINKMLGQSPLTHCCRKPNNINAKSVSTGTVPIDTLFLYIICSPFDLASSVHFA